MIVDELIAVVTSFFDFNSSNVFGAVALLGEAISAKARCCGIVCVVVKTTFCGIPVSFCVKTFIRSPK